MLDKLVMSKKLFNAGVKTGRSVELLRLLADLDFLYDRNGDVKKGDGERVINVIYDRLVQLEVMEFENSESEC